MCAVKLFQQEKQRIPACESYLEITPFIAILNSAMFVWVSCSLSLLSPFPSVYAIYKHFTLLHQTFFAGDRIEFLKATSQFDYSNIFHNLLLLTLISEINGRESTNFVHKNIPSYFLDRLSITAPHFYLFLSYYSLASIYLSISPLITTPLLSLSLSVYPLPTNFSLSLYFSLSPHFYLFLCLITPRVSLCLSLTPHLSLSMSFHYSLHFSLSLIIASLLSLSLSFHYILTSISFSLSLPPHFPLSVSHCSHTSISLCFITTFLIIPTALSLSLIPLHFSLSQSFIIPALLCISISLCLSQKSFSYF